MAWRAEQVQLPSISIFEASITDLLDALAQGTTTSVELTAAYLARIQHYDHRPSDKLPPLNSIHLINPHVFEEAVASDLRRVSGEVRPLEGIPFTVKDSFKVKGMTVACASPAFEHLVANEDSFVVAQLRDAGAVLIGKTNTPPMMYGGMQRGIYGRAESPYNPKYLAAAFGSGSSNGSAVSTAASFAAFGIGSETVSSGRSPASNNALIAYTPSRGVISVRGSWSLYPTCDVVVPHTKCTDDLLRIVDVLAHKDDICTGDYWRQQAIELNGGVELGHISPTGYRALHSMTSEPNALRGKRFGVPRLYIGKTLEYQAGRAVHVDQDVLDLFEQARLDLEGAGAELVEVDFPALAEYENVSAESEDMINVTGLPSGWQQLERSALIAFAWDDFLKQNGQEGLASISDIDTARIFPTHGPDHPQVKYTASKNALQYSKMAEIIRDRGDTTIFELQGTAAALQALESFRKTRFEEHLSEHQLEGMVFPAAGDVARADSDRRDDAAQHAWTDGVKYSHGNQALRHLGIPSITLPMGTLLRNEMPMGITIAGPAYSDINLIKYGRAFESFKPRRQPPALAPPLKSDKLTKPKKGTSAALMITLEDIRKVAPPDNKTDCQYLMMKGVMHVAGASKFTSFWAEPPRLTVYIDGEDRSREIRYYEDGEWEYRGPCRIPPLFDWDEPFGKSSIAAETTGIVLVAKKPGYISCGMWACHR